MFENGLLISVAEVDSWLLCGMWSWREIWKLEVISSAAMTVVGHCIGGLLVSWTSDVRSKGARRSGAEESSVGGWGRLVKIFFSKMSKIEFQTRRCLLGLWSCDAVELLDDVGGIGSMISRYDPSCAQIVVPDWSLCITGGEQYNSTVSAGLHRVSLCCFRVENFDGIIAIAVAFSVVFPRMDCESRPKMSWARMASAAAIGILFITPLSMMLKKSWSDGLPSRPWIIRACSALATSLLVWCSVLHSQWVQTRPLGTRKEYVRKLQHHNMYSVIKGCYQCCTRITGNGNTRQESDIRKGKILYIDPIPSLLW